MSAQRRPAARGYTIVELMMAITVFALGVSGIMAMQKVVATSNQHAKNLAVANHIAQAWQEALASDATLWNTPSDVSLVSDLGETTWLQQVQSSPGVWLRPVHSGAGALAFGPAFDALGNPVDPAAFPARAQFCTHVKLSWLYPEACPAGTCPPGNGLVRAEVRVFWLRDGGGGGVNNQPLCDAGTPAALIGAATNRYHFVYHTSAIEQVPES